MVVEEDEDEEEEEARFNLKSSIANRFLAGAFIPTCAYNSLLPQWLNFKLFLVGFPTKND